MYIVNKAYSGDECVFEFAMCLDCREALNAALSEKSRVAMFDFMHDNMDMEKREEELGTDSPDDDYIAHCATCGKSKTDSASYSLGAMFQSHHMIKGPFPMLICDDCEIKIADTISEETRDTWDKFITENFPGPPSEVKLPSGSKPVLV